MRLRRVPILIIVLAVAMPFATRAVRAAQESDPAVSQVTEVIDADADATVRSWEPDTNFGSEEALEISYKRQGRAATLLRFNLPSMPSGAILDAASLRLFLEDASGADLVTIAAYPVTSSWNEHTITWNSNPTTSLYGLNADIDAEAGYYKSWHITSYVQSWIDEPTSNHGVLLLGPDSGASYERWFESVDHMEMVPQLEITYHVPSFALSGRVYEGEVGDQSQPLGGVTVSAYGANDAFPFQGTLLGSTTTNREGWFGLDVPQGYEVYHIEESDPEGYISVGATAVAGSVRTPNWIEIAAPLEDKTLTGNKFWDRVRPAPHTSVFPDRPPVIDGVMSAGEWNEAPNLPLEHGKLYFQNDAANLYLLVDLTEDTEADPTTNDPPGDYFWLSFDTDLDRAITPHVDLNYGTYRGTEDLGVTRYLGPGVWTGFSSTFSQLGAGFNGSLNEATPHRIWEFAISLAEIDAAPNELVRLGLRTHSSTPSFCGDHPEAFAYDFGSLIEIALVDGDADLLVLADETFLDALELLKAHKEDTGIPTYVQSWQSLNKSFGGQGRDEPERLKKAIAAYERCCDTKWVMLTGDIDRFPVRTVKAINTYLGSLYYPSDLYYADLYDQSGGFDDWDADNDDIFGEIDFDGFGEKDVNKLNLDQIDMYPDVMVGRIPASTSGEVSTYVSKVISYELNARQSDWFKNALWIVDADFGSASKKDRLDGYVDGFNILKRYQNLAPWNSMYLYERAAELNSLMNSGVGFVNYFGHGNVNLWSGWYNSAQFTGLSNADKLPVVYAVSCLTGRYIWAGCDHSSQDYYQATDGSEWQYTSCGTKTGRPQPNPIQPSKYDGDSLAEQFLVKRTSGAVAYVGATSVHEYGGEDLDKYFFEAYSVGWKPPTLGYMWNYALRNWMDNVPLWSYHAFHHMHKVMLFGDPSLRVGGIPPFQKSDFAGRYDMVHDGWEGSLELNAAPDAYIEQLPNLTGMYTDTTDQSHSVRGYMRTWQYAMPSEWGPDHKVEFHVDFPDTPQTEDDQQFDGYLFTQTGEAMAGVTWWNDTPYGFYALKTPSSSVGFRFEAAAADLDKSDFTGVYDMNHDGWEGTLTLRSADGDYVEQLPNLEGTYRGEDGKSHQVRGYVRTPSYPLPEEFGPDHLVLLYVDVNDTLDWDDDQEFEGYLFTQTKHAIAGVTWWHDRPFGFYALKVGSVLEAQVYLPLIRR